MQGQILTLMGAIIFYGEGDGLFVERGRGQNFLGWSKGPQLFFSVSNGGPEFLLAKGGPDFFSATDPCLDCSTYANYLINIHKPQCKHY